MFIVPMTGINDFTEIAKIGKISTDKVSENTAVPSSDVPFADFFKQAVDNVKQTQTVVEQDNVNAMLGNIDNTAQVSINLEKATIAMDLLIQSRNKALDAYNEIMRINV